MAPPKFVRAWSGYYIGRLVRETRHVLALSSRKISNSRANNEDTRVAGSKPLSQVLNNQHDVIMHYVNVITNSGNLKQPGRDTILIETTTTAITYYYYYYYYYYYCECDFCVNPAWAICACFKLFNLDYLCLFFNCVTQDLPAEKWLDMRTPYVSMRAQIRLIVLSF